VEFTEKPELAALRETVGQIAGRYGGAYYAKHAAAHTPLTELWTELAKAGFIGINVPEEFGGGGGGLVELSIVCEEIAAQGLPKAVIVLDDLPRTSTGKVQKNVLRQQLHDHYTQEHQAHDGSGARA